MLIVSGCVITSAYGQIVSQFYIQHSGNRYTCGTLFCLCPTAELQSSGDCKVLIVTFSTNCYTMPTSWALKMVGDSEKITKSSKVDLCNCHPALPQISPLTHSDGKLLYCSVEDSQGGFCRYAKSYSAWLGGRRHTYRASMV